jgi:hypothetical protein
MQSKGNIVVSYTENWFIDIPERGKIMKYTVNVPPTCNQGSYKTIVSGSTYQTKEDEALQDYNSCREHDGLPPIKAMPNGTIYTPIKG